MARQSRVSPSGPEGTSPVLPQAQGLPWARATALCHLLALHDCCHFAASTEAHALGCPGNACLESVGPHWATHCLSMAPCQQPNGCPIHSRVHLGGMAEAVASQVWGIMVALSLPSLPVAHHLPPRSPPQLLLSPPLLPPSPGP